MRPVTGLRVGRIFGIPVYLHGSWFIIFALITISLQAQLASRLQGQEQAAQWALGIATSMLFFASVLFHELGHSVVALRYKIPVASITLFVFGGLARIAREPSSARQEFNIAIAGPVASFFLGAMFLLANRLAAGRDMLSQMAGLLSQINFVLGGFNLVPGFPLDGGRILRAAAWGLTGDFSKATRIASRIGVFFAYLLILYGIWTALKGNWVNGLWFAFIGWFLLSAAQESYAQVAIRDTLAGLKAADAMSREVPLVSRDISLLDYVHEVLRTGRRFHIVTGNGAPVGLITLHAARDVPREEWANTSVQAVMLPPEKIQWARASEPLPRVLDRMQTLDLNQMPVIDNDHIVGVVARDNILHLIQTRLQAGHMAEQ